MVRDRYRVAFIKLAEVDGIAGLHTLIGVEIGPSRWRTITQKDIDAFAEISGNHRWIHVDVERARAESPHGMTIAHGNLTLSMVDGFRHELIMPAGVTFGLNYGWNKIRFPAPVPVGSNVRARAELVSLKEKGDDWWEVVTRFTVEVEGVEKPAFAGESIIRQRFAAAKWSSVADLLDDSQAVTKRVPETAGQRYLRHMPDPEPRCRRHWRRSARRRTMRALR